MTTETFPTLKKYGLIPTMVPGGCKIEAGMNDKSLHAAMDAKTREAIKAAAAAGAPNVIVLAGGRKGLGDQRAWTTACCFSTRSRQAAEDQGVTICMELLNSKVNHKDYMCDHTAWGVEVCKRVGSPRVKLLYDIYHMQIMEGDMIRTIRENIAVHRPFPHRRRSRPPRDRRYAGAELARHRHGHRRPQIPGLYGPRILARHRPPGNIGQDDEDLRGVSRPDGPAPRANPRLNGRRWGVL